MSTEAIVTIIGTACTVAAVVGGVAWAVKRLEKEVDGVRQSIHEMRNGFLLRQQDQLTRHDEQIEDLERRVDRLEIAT